MLNSAGVWGLQGIYMDFKKPQTPDHMREFGGAVRHSDASIWSLCDDMHNDREVQCSSEGM